MTTLDDAELEKVVWQAYKSWSDDPDRGKYPEKTLVAHTIKALKQIRDARLVGPSKQEAELASLQARSEDFQEGFMSCYRWRRSQLRLEPTETKARVSDEELEKLIDEFYTDVPNGWGPRTKLKKLLQKVSR